ncbi:Glycosyltransferase involved in cell wall bisynthesis [Flavobacterium sp. CF108]|uniref:glycosyltransferase family 4 protein n=1 Tax=unclassified Flavobacterium TaxID=196869 RepID=UPI0008CB9E0A|nr:MULTISPECIES: glycosyltransferase [unclassified Flavobacterium]SEO48803.1 Glycosyltransferase involved in cell wall bisynthesis [Flavobacterium sp. fv08]SHH71757.1 Glycosyltransferase involved in cell wall bisynthesis [Flavobacterium sp. CF108]
MNFTIITHVIHYKDDSLLLGYGPYIREMNIWLKHVDNVTIVAPFSKEKGGNIDLAYQHSKISFNEIPALAFNRPLRILKSMLNLPLIIWKIFMAMQNSDHIHLRCPGNVGLISCFVQVFFPNKIKTAKYAGNWDPKSKQPWTYNLQKYILNNTFLTRNMQVLVYGEWENQSKNIKSFFTATYSDYEKGVIQKRNLNLGAEFVFVGSLVTGKNPMYALKLINGLVKKETKVMLNIFGEGPERNNIENYIQENKLEDLVFLHGNQNQDIIKDAYKRSHFVILPSKSEGWPKAVAEGMFWSNVPLSTNVSCISYMLDKGKRGILLEMNLEKDLVRIENLLLDQTNYIKIGKLAAEWSQNYTTEVFETEIEKLIIK